MSLPDPDEMFRRHQAEHDAEVAKSERERIIKLLRSLLEPCCAEATSENDGATSSCWYYLHAITLIKGENK